MDIKENLSLKEFNTFGLDAKCRYFTSIENINDLVEIINTYEGEDILILGGGSNILLTKDYQGMVIHNQIKGIEIESEDADHVVITVSGGEIWQDLVDFALANDLGGIENLSLIPGLVGAAPIQNIGAYGVELKDVLVSLDAIDLATGELRTFMNEECKFGYRNSVFKNEYLNKFFIISVRIQLDKEPAVNTAYGAINSVLESKGITNPTIQNVSDVVIEIRQSKLPDPAVLGNAGSFFKNPVIDKIYYEALQLEFPDIPGYIDGESVKVPAAWLIDQSGWKGVRRGNVGVHDLQPLVLVNHGGGTGAEILSLANEILDSIAIKFGIELEPEPRII
ncbi:MAG: UDP-N-acetylmuramate dehydrogenase [Bacteroidota bacterium]